MLLPFVDDILGVSGSIQLFCLMIFRPTQMYIKQNALLPGSYKRNTLQLLNLGFFVITLLACIGSVVSLVQDTKGYHLFNNTHEWDIAY